MPERAHRRAPGAPRPLSEAIGRVRGQLEPPTLLARAQAEWAQAVGEAVAEQSEPVSERAGVITVACRSATWASELTLLTQSLLEGLNKRLAEGSAEGSPTGVSASGLKFTVRPS